MKRIVLNDESIQAALSLSLMSMRYHYQNCGIAALCTCSITRLPPSSTNLFSTASPLAVAG